MSADRSLKWDDPEWKRQQDADDERLKPEVDAAFSTREETRRHERREGEWNRPGKTSVAIECPFCGEGVWAYPGWLRTKGKKCPCGAKHFANGFTTKEAPDA
jgi:hypothetical protein